MSGYYVLPYFMPAHDAYSWLSRLWVATLPCNISCLLMMPILGSSESEWPLCLAIFCACSPVLGSPVCEWLLFPAIFHACSWCLFLALQPVSSYFALQYFMPAHDACTWLSRMWVATLPCIISCLLMMLVLGSPGSECLAIFHAWLWCLYLALQVVSGYFASPCFMPAHDTCSWLSRMSVIAVPCHVLCLLMMFLTFQEVSDCCTLPYFMPAHHACSWLSRLWVAICLPIVYTCLWCLFLALQFVSGYCALPYSCLVMMPVLGSPACEWLLYLALFYAFSWCLFLAYQKVSGYSALPYFMLAHDACFWPSRKWVAIFHAWLWCLYLALQIVSGSALPYFMPAHASSWLSRLWVAALLPYFIPAHASSCLSRL